MAYPGTLFGTFEESKAKESKLTPLEYLDLAVKDVDKLVVMAKAIAGQSPNNNNEQAVVFLKDTSQVGHEAIKEAEQNRTAKQDTNESPTVSRH